MSVNAINTNDNKRSDVSYLKALAIGGLGGYALKHILPITQHEKDGRYRLYLDNIKKQVTETKLKEIEAIRNYGNKTLAEDTFINMVDKNEINLPKLRAIQEPTASGVLKIITEVNNKGRIAKESAKEVFTIVTKHIRPTKSFFAMGAGVAVATAFVHNTLGRFSDK